MKEIRYDNESDSSQTESALNCSSNFNLSSSIDQLILRNNLLMYTRICADGFHERADTAVAATCEKCEQNVDADKTKVCDSVPRLGTSSLD